jgi:hypothetical protein
MVTLEVYSTFKYLQLHPVTKEVVQSFVLRTDTKHPIVVNFDGLATNVQGVSTYVTRLGLVPEHIMLCDKTYGPAKGNYPGALTNHYVFVANSHIILHPPNV